MKSVFVIDPSSTWRHLASVRLRELGFRTFGPDDTHCSLDGPEADTDFVVYGPNALTAGKDALVMARTEGEQPVAEIAKIKLALAEIPAPGQGQAPSRTMLRAGALTLDLSRFLARIDGREVELTQTQADLLAHFMQNPNRCISSRDLLTVIWGYREGVGDTGLVRWHIRTLRERIEADPSDPRYLLTRGRKGYCLAI